MNFTPILELTTSEKITLIREDMHEFGINAYIIADADPHMSEYPADHWKCREWLTGFCGSNGTILITAESAGLWTDSRYYEIAERAINDTEIELFKMSDIGVPSIDEWLIQNLKSGDSVGINTSTVSAKRFKQLQKDMNFHSINTVSCPDLTKNIWHNRPALPVTQAYILEDEYSGESAQNKVLRVREKMRINAVEWHLVTRIDEICWLLNLRGSDVECQSLLISFLLISQDKIILFIDDRKLNSTTIKSLEKTGINIHDYEYLKKCLKLLPSQSRIQLNPEFVNQDLYVALSHCRILENRDIITDLKTIKNDVEINNLKKCLRYDATALVRMQIWLEESFQNKSYLSENIISEKLYELRSQLPGYLHPSFPNIVGYNANGALNHYFVSKETDTELSADGGLILIDSGGTYLSGTTDTTRVFNLGEATDIQKEDYTITLKGLINLSTATFPVGTGGAGLDALCREPMWKHKRDFKHGTGHGVGFSLNVHEGPQNINKKCVEELKPGMITTIEPGIYRPGEFGIRIENITLCIEDNSSVFGEFLRFETLTAFPFNIDLIKIELLDEQEKKWINAFHSDVIANLGELLDTNELNWLKNKCSQI